MTNLVIVNGNLLVPETPAVPAVAAHQVPISLTIDITPIVAAVMAGLPVSTTPPVTTPPPVVIPPAGVPKLDFVISQNGSAPVAGADNWDLNAFYNSTVNPFPGHTASVLCTLINPNGGFQPLFVPNGSLTFFDTSPYAHLVFSACPTVDGAGFWIGFDGNEDTPDGTQIQVAGPSMTKYGPAPQKGQWGTWIIPLADFGMSNRTAVFKFGIVCGPIFPADVQYDNVGFTKN